MGASSIHHDDEAVATPFKYKAFISYSHKDEKIVKRLHRRLEQYRIPKTVRSTGRDLKPIFRDREELAASSGLNHAIKDALQSSESLIVICSPDAVKSQWVNEEIILFKQLGRAERIFTVIVDGEPYASEKPDGSDDECLPRAVRFQLDEDGKLGTVKAEPLAADFRPQGDGEKVGTLKLISGIAGVGLDHLVQRDLVRARRRLVGVSTLATTIILALSTLTWTAYQAQKAANVAQQEADARRADAEDLVEFMLSDHRGQLESFGRLDLMESVGEKVIEYYDQFDDLDFDTDTNGRRARAHHFMGELQDSLGKIELSDTYFVQSYAITKQGLTKDPNNVDRMAEHARSAYFRSLPLRREGKHAEEMVYLQEYEQLANALFALENGTIRSMSHLGAAKTNLGRVNFKLGNIKKARIYFEEADKLLEQAAGADDNVKGYLSVGENLSWLADTYRVSDDYEMAYKVRRRQVDVLEALYARHSDDFRALEGVVYAELGLGNAARYYKRYDEAVKLHEAVLFNADKALELEPGREKMMRAQAAALLGLLNAALETRDYESYKLYKKQMSDVQSKPMLKSVKDNSFWSSGLPKAIGEIDKSYASLVKPKN